MTAGGIYDLDPNFKFPQAVPDLHKGKFTAIPRTDKDLHPKNHIQAIANTAEFHMPTIEQGGNSHPPETKGIAMAVVMFLTGMGLFIGQPKGILRDVAGLSRRGRCSRERVY